MKKDIKSYFSSLLLVALLFVSALLMATSLSAEYVVDGITYVFDKDGDGVIITGLSRSPAEVVIPEAIEGRPVTEIRTRAFSYCDTLSSITLPESLVTIGDGAFYHCTSLKSIVIPDGAISIGKSAFEECSSLESIWVPEGIYVVGWNAFLGTAYYNEPSNWSNGILYVGDCLVAADERLSGDCAVKADTRVIASNAFRNNSLIESVVLPDGLKSIGNGAFSGCTSLSDVNLPDSLEFVGGSVFENCGIESVRIPEGLTDVSSFLFYGSKLKSITISKGVRSVGFRAFDCCVDIETIVVEEGNPVYHSEGNCLIETKSKTLVLGCKSSVIPDDGSVIAIGEESFSNCLWLESIVIPEGVASIVGFSFVGCTNLSTITLPESLKELGLWDLCHFDTVYYNGSPDQWKKIYAKDDYSISYDEIVFGKSCTHEYDSACDSSCNVCGEKRTVEGHVYDNDCDKSCNVCNAERTAQKHKYDGENDSTCNVCGYERDVQKKPLTSDTVHKPYPDTEAQAESENGTNVKIAVPVLCVVSIIVMALGAVIASKKDN